MKQIIIEVKQQLGPIAIRVPLPYDLRAEVYVQGELERIETMIKREDMATFKAQLQWIPRTLAQLVEAETLAKSMDWHTAAARSLGYRECGCPMCDSPVRMMA